jgi:hypothetical protein
VYEAPEEDQDDEPVIPQEGRAAMMVEDEAELEDFLSPDVSATPTVNVDGEPLYKAAVIKSFFHNWTKGGNASRLARVKAIRTYTSPTSHTSAEVGPSEHMLTLRDPVVTLVTIPGKQNRQQQTCLGVFVCEKIYHKPADKLVEFSSVSFDDIQQYSLSGRLLILEHFPPENDWDVPYVQWNTQYGDELKGIPGASVVAIGHLTKQRFIYIPFTQKGHHSSFIFSLPALEEVAKTLWTVATENVSTKLPTWHGRHLPYLVGNASILVADSRHIASTTGEKAKCKLCGIELDWMKMRRHVGYHYWYSQRNCEDPCGWCGQSLERIPACITTVHKSAGGAGTMQSNCSLFYRQLKLLSGVRGQSTKCTNVPMQCPVEGCNRWIWLYWAANHIVSEHNHSQEYLNTLMWHGKPVKASDGTVFTLTISEEEKNALAAVEQAEGTNRNLRQAQ